jgi:hypothetical protein
VQVAPRSGVVDLVEDLATVRGQPQEAGAPVVGIRVEGCEPVSHEVVRDGLNVLPGHAESAGDRGHRELARSGDPHHLPARLGLADAAGDRVAVPAHGARYFEEVGSEALDLEVPLLVLHFHDGTAFPS